MSKAWKAPDKVTQKMTRDGADAENLTTGETTSISEKPQEENYSQAPTAAAEKAVDRIGAEDERQTEGCVESHRQKSPSVRLISITTPRVLIPRGQTRRHLPHSMHLFISS